MLDDLNPVQEWGRASSLIYCYCNLLWQGLPPVFGVFAPWDTDSISLHCVWVQDLPQRMWLLKQVKSMLSQRTHLPLVYILWFHSEAAQVFISFPLVFIPDIVQSYGWGSGHCDCRNWDGFAAPKSRLPLWQTSPGYNRSRSNLSYGVKWVGWRHSHWKIKCWVLLPRACLPKIQKLATEPSSRAALCTHWRYSQKMNIDVKAIN